MIRRRLTSADLPRLRPRRVSTEDRQAPEDSIAWQRSVAAASSRHQAVAIVAEYLDVGVSRVSALVAAP